MRLADIKGQDRVINILKRAVATNRLSSGYIFEGMNGTGKRSTALALMQVLFCQNQADGDSCGNCISCRKFSSGNHPDLHLLEPLPDKRDISIEQIRGLQQVLALRPFEAGHKGCLIEPAERMNEKGANALLKTLEEPPGKSVFILIAPQSEMLLSTIRSRCQIVRFNRLDEATIRELLVTKGIEPDRASELAPLSEGSIELALSRADEAELSRREELLAVLSQVTAMQVDTVLNRAETLAKGREEMLCTFDQLLSILHDMLLLSTGDSSRVSNRFMFDKLAKEATRFDRSGILELIEKGLSVRRGVQGNINPKLALEHFLLSYDRFRKGVR